MSKIAQSLLEELVEPTIKRSIRENEPKRYSDYKYIQRTPSKQDSRTRAILLGKKNVFNKLAPKDSSASRTLKSKELLRKGFVDNAVNTVVTGPLRCDNTCVTMLRKRDNTYSCRCGQKRLNNKSSSKLVQTFGVNFSFTDKACTHCVETDSCGTQVIERLSHDKLQPQISTGRRSHNDIQSISFKDMPKYNSRDMRQASSNLSKRTNSKLYMGARRWALSQYPTRGPDF